MCSILHPKVHSQPFFPFLVFFLGETFMVATIIPHMIWSSGLHFLVVCFQIHLSFVKVTLKMGYWWVNRAH